MLGDRGDVAKGTEGTEGTRPMIRINISEDGERAILHAPDTFTTANVLAGLEGRRVHLRAGGISIIWSGHNRDIIFQEWPGAEIVTPVPILIPTRTLSSAYVPRTTHLEHQAIALARIRAVDRPVYALFMEPGTGKTKVALDVAGELFMEEDINRLLIIAPKGVHRQWVNQQIPEHLGTKWEAVAWPKDYTDIEPNDAVLQIFAINYDAAKTVRGMNAILKFLRPGEPFMLVLDESHQVKNSKSARWKAILKIAQNPNVRFKMLLTGTPIAKNLLDEWAQFWLLDPNIIGTKYMATFKREYCIMGGWEMREIVGHRNLDRFKKITAPYNYRIRREALGMVPDEYRIWYLNLSDQQRNLIKDIKTEAIILLDSDNAKLLGAISSHLMKIQQVSNGWIKDDEGNTIDIVSPDKNPRLIALQEWIGDADLEAYPVAIWCRFHRDIEQIKSIYPDAIPYYGPISDKEREAGKERWLKEGGIFLGTPGSGGVGLNLQGRCARVGYYSLSENYVDRVQSEARFSRLGKLGPIEYTDFIARGCRDFAIRRNLNNKRSLADLTLDDIRKELDDV